MSDGQEAAAWFRRRTLATTSDATEVAAMLDGRRISVVLPARNEESTIGAIVTSIQEQLIERVPLVHEIIVVDSRSTDATTERAEDAGATVHRMGTDGRDGGKGAALQAGLAQMSGDIGVFLDADVTDFDPSFVVRLLAPLLRDPSLVLVKGFYDRPWSGSGERPTGGGRVTELVARPLLRRHEPRLDGFAQPLAGECSFVRRSLERLPFVSGYGVEIGLLLHILRVHGLDSLGQTDLGTRLHPHQDLDALARMAAQLESAVALSLDSSAVLVGSELEQTRVAFSRGASGAMEMRREHVHTWLLPPLVS